MNPYQQASTAMREGEELPFDLAKKGAMAVVGAKGVGKIASAVGSLINPYVPDNIMLAGLKKLDPRLGNFAEKSLNDGYAPENVREFLSQKMQQSEQASPAKQKGNIVEQYDPELHSYIQEKIKKGEGVLEAGNKALGHSRFKKAVDKLVKDHKVSWAEILQSVYGMGERAQTKQQQAQAMPLPQPPQQQAPQVPQQAQQQPQQGQATQALMQALQAAQEARKRRQ